MKDRGGGRGRDRGRDGARGEEGRGTGDPGGRKG